MFWTDQQEQGSDDTPAMAWRIMGKNLVDGRQVVVSHSSFPSPAPIPRAGAGRLVWFEQSTSTSPPVTIKAFDTTTRSSSDLVTGIAAPTNITAGLTFAGYDVLTNGLASDEWRVPWTGGRPTRVTGNGTSRNVRAAGDSDTAVWEKAAVGDSTGLVAGDLDHPAQEISLGFPGASNAVPGDGFVAFLAADGSVKAAPLAPHPTALTLSSMVPSVPCRIAVSGRRLAFCQSSGNSDTSMSVVIDEVRTAS